MNNNDQLATVETVDLETVVGGDAAHDVKNSDAVKRYTEGAKSSWSAWKHVAKGEFKDAAKDAGNAWKNNIAGHIDLADAAWKAYKG